jgi:hypothetical protein
MSLFSKIFPTVSKELALRRDWKSKYKLRQQSRDAELSEALEKAEGVLARAEVIPSTDTQEDNGHDVRRRKPNDHPHLRLLR